MKAERVMRVGYLRLEQSGAEWFHQWFHLWFHLFRGSDPGSLIEDLYIQPG